MKRLFTILVAAWLVVFLYFLFIFIISSSIRSWGWLIVGIIGVFYLAALCGVSGVIGVVKYNTLIRPALFNGVCGLLCGMFLGEKGILLFAVGGFLVTFIFALIAYVFTAKTSSVTVPEPDKQVVDPDGNTLPLPVSEVSSTSLPPIPKPLKYFLIAVIIVLLNVFAAWCSWHRFIIDRDVYWKELTAHASHLTPKHFSEREGHPKNLLFDDSGNLFTGVVEAYKPQLRINPFSPEPKGVEYYVNGKCWGISTADRHVVHPLRMYMSDIVPRDSRNHYFIYDEYIRDIRSQIQEECDHYLIHKDYIENVRTIVDEYMDGYVILPGKSSFIQLLGTGSGMLWRLRVSFHEENGIVDRIGGLEQKSLDSEDGWRRWDDYSYFDRLGKIKGDSEWKRDDFVFVDSFPDPVMSGVGTASQKKMLKETLLSSGRFYYWDETYRWDENQGVLENLYKFYQRDDDTIPDHIIYTGVTNSGGKRIEGADRKFLLDLLSRCNHFTIEDDCTVFLREPGVSYLMVALEDQIDDIPLYYVDGRFILRYSFYSFPVDDPADRKRIEKLIEKYKA